VSDEIKAVKFFVQKSFEIEAEQRIMGFDGIV
jgi:hypothetical protein